MPRELSREAVSSLLAQRTSELWLEIVTITSTDEDGSNRMVQARWVKDSEQVVSNGETYMPSYWQLILPPSDPEKLPIAKFQLDNVKRELIEEIRATRGIIEVEHSVIMKSSPDVIEVGPIRYNIQDVQYDAGYITGTLGHFRLADERYPIHKFSPAYFPGLF